VVNRVRRTRSGTEGGHNGCLVHPGVEKMGRARGRGRGGTRKGSPKIGCEEGQSVSEGDVLSFLDSSAQSNRGGWPGREEAALDEPAEGAVGRADS